jgi:hypothetical protein
MMVATKQPSTEERPMSSIPQVARAMQHVLSDVARQAARTTGFIQRQRAFDGAQFVQTLVFGWLAHPHATTDQLVSLAADLGVTLSAPGLSERFTDKAVACLEQVLQAAIGQLIAADPLNLPLLARFPAVLLHDTTTISLPDELAAQYRGCGGSHGRVAAALKAHLRLELRTGQLEGPLLQDGRAHDRALGFRQRPVEGALVLRDLGFFQLDDLALEQRDGRHWISRLKPNTAVFRERQRVNLLELLTAQGDAPLDCTITLGVRQQIACRLLAQPVPQEVADQRRRRIQKEARDKGTRVRAERLALCGWTIVVTTLTSEQASLLEVLVLLKLRWQIELLIKLWKSQGQVDKSRGQRPARILAEVYAKFLGMLVQHWLLLLGCWQAPERSLPKAAAQVRAAAYKLARALAGSRRLRAALRTLVQRLATAKRQTKRRSKPNAYQFLQDPTLLLLT